MHVHVHLRVHVCGCMYAWRTSSVHLDGRRHHAHDLGVPRRQVHLDVFQAAPHEVLVLPVLPDRILTANSQRELGAPAGKWGEG